MRIVQWDGSDPGVLQACIEVLLAEHAADDPLGPPPSPRRIRGWLEHQTDPMELWLVEGSAGGVDGWYRLRLPQKENRDRAGLGLSVHPAARRRGIGTALLRHAAARAASHQRSVLASWAFQDSPGAAFARRMGATPGLVDARRVQVLASLPAGRIAALREQAARAAAGYSLVTWRGRTPERYLAGFAEVLNAANDMPRDPGDEDEVWDADRVRAHDDVDELRGRRLYTVAALHDATGEMAALTDVEADPEAPAWGHQMLTAVVRKHRGHRLGMLVKTAMLQWLAEAEPQLERIVTGNATVNQPMIAINEDLGYQLLEPAGQSFEMPVAAALALAGPGPALR
jgi:GNAT superfamily N-acetyltransferase